MSFEKDTLFSTPLASGRFSFDEQVVGVFPDMIRRSVPGYASMLAMIGQMAAMKHKAQNRPLEVLDIGCSLGAVGLSIISCLPPEQLSLWCLDVSKPMIDKASEHFAAHPDYQVELVCADALDCVFPEADLVVMNLTLQFIDQAKRQKLLSRLFNALRPGGQIVLSEKLNLDGSSYLTAVHEQFKRANGYSELEIAQKRAQLEEVLVPETKQQHLGRLSEVGFVDAELWFQYLNFASFVGFKPL